MTAISEVDLAALASLGVEVRRGVSLAPMTTMKIGGQAEVYADVTNLQQLIDLVRWAQASHVDYFVLGGGSNILISDAGMRGLVIHNRCRTVRLVDLPTGKPLSGLDHEQGVYAESGAAMAGVARYCVRAALGGLEWAVSVPGTIGGAVVGNAGAHGGEIRDNLIAARILETDGQIVERTASELGYAYRDSVLKRRRPLQAGQFPVVLAAIFRLASGDAEAIKQRADGYLTHRRRTQPAEPSLGSTFKNPPDDHAGRLIEAAGLKGKRIGGVEVSQVHANFFINPGGVGAASAADVMALIEHVQAVVESKFGVRLQPEIQLAGDW